MNKEIEKMALLYYTIFVVSITLAESNHDHTVPTFFGKLDESGKLINRDSPDYNSEIESKKWINKISRDDASTIKLEAWPKTVRNGEKVTVLWKGVSNPDSKDLITYYCPFYDDINHYLDYFHASSSLSWKEGYGHHSVKLYNMRTPCVFKLFRAQGKYYVLAATSNKVYFADGGPYAPLQGRISMTNKPTEMRVMWTSGEVEQPPVVRYGPTKDVAMKENAYLTHTYTKDDMCQAPANDKGFWHPGTVYDVLLKNLQPNTLYYYSYGTDAYMSQISNFTTPLPKGDKTPFKFIIYGDMGVDPYPEAYTTAKIVRKDLDVNKIRFINHIGDISYARGYAYIWEQWSALVEPVATLVPYMITIGNHEYDHTAGGLGRDPSKISTDAGWKPEWFNGHTDSGGECSVPMFKRFHMPENGNNIYWYSYDYGLVHMIMMSTEHDFSPNSTQYKWLENDLKNVDRKVTPWVFIGGHRAMYCSEKIFTDYVVATFMQKLFEDLLYKYKVDIAFWAHYHSYERTCKVYRNKCVDDGVVHIVVGSAGKSKDGDDWYPKDWSLFRKAEYGYGRLNIVNATAMSYEWIENKHNEVKDTVWLYK